MLKMSVVFLTAYILFEMLAPKLACPSNFGFKKLFMPGELTADHAKYEEKCSNCHESFKKSLQRHLCLKCHKKVAADVKDKKGFHGLNNKILIKDCKYCHTDHKGRKFSIIQWDKDMFDHSLTDFKLKGGHENLMCSGCHDFKKKYRDTSSVCIDCHKNKDFHDGKMGKKCIDCHEEKKWSSIRFDHDKTKFKLEGKHKKAYCRSCHPNSKYKKTPVKCIECHGLNDVHGGIYSKNCKECHNFEGWKKSTFKHKKTESIKGIKAKDCYRCHKNNDIHKGRYGKICAECHRTKKWKPSKYDHSKTKFTLKEKHKKIDCDTCHTGNLYKDKLEIKCYFCHKKNDEHNSSYGGKCEDCHTQKQWKIAEFDHNKFDFKLDGKHEKVSCNLCHKGKLYKDKAEIVCEGCHKFDDLHKDLFGKACILCHTPKEWKPSVLNHDKSVLPGIKNLNLMGCDKCYTERLGKDCYGCHKPDDIHDNKEGKECNSCHNVDSWNKKVNFDHDITRFPLIGLHSVVSCEECHLDKNYKGLKSDCADCHKSNDVHKDRLGSKCFICHNPNNWRVWNFDHDTQSEFKLEGAHKYLNCLECHKKPVKEKFDLSKTCFSCHENDSVHSGKYWKKCEKCHIDESFDKIIIKPN